MSNGDRHLAKSCEACVYGIYKVIDVFSVYYSCVVVSARTGFSQRPWFKARCGRFFNFDPPSKTPTAYHGRSFGCLSDLQNHVPRQCLSQASRWHQRLIFGWHPSKDSLMSVTSLMEGGNKYYWWI